MSNQKGFTLIELLIATTVFSVLLLILTGGILTIGRTYQKNVVKSKTLNVARSITDEIAQSIQFAGGEIVTGLTPINGVKGYCIGGRLYSYLEGVRLDGNNHALMTERVTDCATSPTPVDITASNPTGQEMLAKGMRVSKIDIQNVSGNLYSVAVRIVYGDRDLLCSPTLANCGPSGNISDDEIKANAGDIRCRDGRFGTQFCAVSEFETTVERRIQL